MSEREGIDMVNRPPHYAQDDPTYEPIRVIDAWGLDFCLGNAVKYISRAGKKGSKSEDLRKSIWYIQHALDKLDSAEAD